MEERINKFKEKHPILVWVIALAIGGVVAYAIRLMLG